MRDLIAESWRRSHAAGVNPDRLSAPIALPTAELTEYRKSHLLMQVFPLLRDVLGRAAESCGCVMAVGDHEGRLLWVEGGPAAKRLADGIQFTAGTQWTEALVGTNAPGTALRLDRAIQVSSREHFSATVKDWSCSAAPIHHPDTGQPIGFVDVSGTGIVDTPQTLAMVRAGARMAESELGRLSMLQQIRDMERDTGDVLDIAGLGRPDLLVTWRGRKIRLSRRHSDIIAVLADQTDGLSADQLAVEAYDIDVALSSMRAQVTRLRNLFGDGVLDSRPYRFDVEVRCDWLEVLELLRARRVGEAVRRYHGPLLPNSDSPGVVSRRQAIERELTRALLRSDDPNLLASATQTRWGCDNLELWERQLALLPVTSPLRAATTHEVARLREEYDITPRLLPNRLHGI